MAFDPHTVAKLQNRIGRMYKSEVPETQELHRILDLPRRVWEKRSDIDELVQDATEYLKKPGGAQTLLPIQAVALQEAHDLGGGFIPIPVGGGKTHVTFLAPYVMEAQRPLLVVPARLRDKTIREFAGLEQHWKKHPSIQIVSYEKLSRENGTAFLQGYRPDLIIFDEAHRLKNKSAAVTRKISAWMRTFPETKVIALSGTVTSRSILDFAHILRWCARTYYPLPIPQLELEAWAAAVDEIKLSERREANGPGALIKLCDSVEKSKGRDGVRSALRRRIYETPGIIAGHGGECEASLNITLSLESGYSDRIKHLAARLNEGILPNGDVFVEEASEFEKLSARWRIMRTLTSGFWYDWNPKPPREWLDIRSTWRKIVRRLLDEHLPGLDSPMQIARAAAENKLGLSAHEAYLAWKRVEKSHTWEVTPVWEDDIVIKRVEKWSKHNRGIIWVNEVALGERLEKDLGLPYYHRMGLDKLGRYIESARPKDGCIVASVGSNSEGRNLQEHWSDNYVISPMPVGKDWEQLIGRTHRQKQKADEVWFEVLFGCAVEWQCWNQAMRDSRYQSAQDSTKKLTIATIDRTFDIPKEAPLW